MPGYVYRESYKHRYAKKLLISWLRELDEKQDGCNFGCLSWRSNYGVHEELPFYETSDPFYFEMSHGLIYDDGIKYMKNYKHQELFDPKINRGRLLFVPDISIFHKGSVKYLVEVVHKSPPTVNKINLINHFFAFHQADITLVIISADHILGQIKKPKSLNFEPVLTM